MREHTAATPKFAATVKNRIRIPKAINRGLMYVSLSWVAVWHSLLRLSSLLFSHVSVLLASVLQIPCNLTATSEHFRGVGKLIQILQVHSQYEEIRRDLDWGCSV